MMRNYDSAPVVCWRMEWCGEGEVGVMSDKVEGTRSCRSGVLREQIATVTSKNGLLNEQFMQSRGG